MRNFDPASMNDLLSHPVVARTVNDRTVQTLNAWLDKDAAENPDPLLMKVLAGVGAWFASWFLIGFVISILMLITKDAPEVAAIIIGFVLMMMASPLLQNTRSVFLRQMALASALAGNVLLLAGIGIASEGRSSMFASVVIAQAILTAIAWEFMNHSVYRFIAATSTFILATAWAYDVESAGFLYTLIGIELACAGLLFSRSLAHRYMPLVYAGVISVLGTLGFMSFTQRGAGIWRDEFPVHEAPLVLMLTGALIAFVARQYHHAQLSLVALVAAIAALSLLGFITAPGILAAILLLAVAHATADRLLGVVAALFLPWFLYHYYYALDVSLAYKSMTMLASGGLLLFAFWVSGKRKGA